MIRIRQLSKAFAKNEVLKDINLDFNRAGITAILGPNGSGKSTLIKCILGMVIPDKGQIHFDEHSIRRQCAYRRHISYLPQIADFPANLKVEELFTMIKDLRGQGAQDQALIQLFDLEAFLKKPLGQLSGGTRQKVNLVTAFMYDSPVIMLDEPTSGLDPVAMIGLRKLIREERDRGKIILITTHIMSFVEEMAEDLIFLLDGQVKFGGSLQELKQLYEEPDLEKAIANLLYHSKNGKAPLSEKAAAQIHRLV